MIRQSRCAYVVAVAGTALSLSLAGSVLAQPVATVIAVKNNLNAAAPAGLVNNGPVPGLDPAVVADAAAHGLTISWSQPFSGSPGLSNVPVIDSFGNVAFYGQMGSQGGANSPGGATSNFYDTQVTVGGNTVTVRTYLINQSNQNAVFWSSAASQATWNSTHDPRDYWSSNLTQIAARDGSSGSPSSVDTTTSDNTLGGPLLGGPTPNGMASGWTLNSVAANPGNGIGANRIAMSSSGYMYVGASTNGSGATSTTSSTMFTGVPNLAGAPSGTALTVTAVQSGAAPGIAHALLNTGPGGLSNLNQVNPVGKMGLVSTLVSDGNPASDVVTTAGATQNSSALFVMQQGGTGTLVARQAQSPAFLNGAAFGAFSGIPQINGNGDVVFTHTLSTLAGTTPAIAGSSTIAGNTQVLCANVGGTTQLIARQGGAVTVNGNPETYLAKTSASVFTLTGTNNSSGEPWNNSGRLVYTAKFAASANITAGTNDAALMTWQGGTSSVLYQAGVTPVPGFASNTFSTTGVPSGNVALNNNNHIAFGGTMNVGGAITTSNNSGLWFQSNLADSSSATLIAQGGMTAPGEGGATFGNNFNATIMNNRDTIVFTNTLSNGLAGIFAYNPSWGLIDVLTVGNTSVLGANYPIGSFNYSLGGNGDGGVVSLNDSDQLALSVTGSNNASGSATRNFAIITITVPSPATGGMALLGLAGLARRRRTR